jgi:hypothetical protein
VLRRLRRLDPGFAAAKPFLVVWFHANCMAFGPIRAYIYWHQTTKGHIWAGRDCCAALICPAQTSHTARTLCDILAKNFHKTCIENTILRIFKIFTKLLLTNKTLSMYNITYEYKKKFYIFFCLNFYNINNFNL